MKKDLIFDLDGTLWDSRSTLVKLWNKIFIKYGLIKKPLIETDFNRFMGLLLTDIFAELFPQTEKTKLNQVQKELHLNEIKILQKEGGILYDGVKEVLERLKIKYDLYIVSNCQDGYIEAFFKYFDFSHLFKDFESAGRTGKNKAANIASVLERNQINPVNAVYIGDTQTDYDSAKENGIDFIFCKYGFGKLDSNSKVFAQINSFKDLEKIFNSII